VVALLTSIHLTSNRQHLFEIDLKRIVDLLRREEEHYWTHTDQTESVICMAKTVAHWIGNLKDPGSNPGSDGACVPEPVYSDFQRSIWTSGWHSLSEGTLSRWPDDGIRKDSEMLYVIKAKEFFTHKSLSLLWVKFELLKWPWRITWNIYSDLLLCW